MPAADSQPLSLPRRLVLSIPQIAPKPLQAPKVVPLRSIDDRDLRCPILLLEVILGASSAQNYSPGPPSSRNPFRFMRAVPHQNVVHA
jgi:hypothetical protein